MLRLIQLFLFLVLIILLQVSLLPIYLEDSFKPNLTIILVCFLALRGKNSFLAAAAAYFVGLLHGVFSGLDFGLTGISSLLIYLFLRKISDQLFTDSNHLMLFAVAIASIADALLSVLFITLLSGNTAVYKSILSNMIPQAVITTIISSIIFPVYSIFKRRRYS